MWETRVERGTGRLMGDYREGKEEARVGRGTDEQESPKDRENGVKERKWNVF